MSIRCSFHPNQIWLLHVFEPSLDCYYIFCAFCHCYSWFFFHLLSLPFGLHQRRLACSLFIFTTARHYCSTLLNECDFVSYCFSVHMKIYPYIRVHIFSIYGSWLTIYTYSRTRCYASVFLSLSHTLAYFLSVAFDFPWMGRIQKRDCRHCFRSAIRYIRWSLNVYDYYQHRLAGAYSYCHSIFSSLFLSTEYQIKRYWYW